MTLGFLRFSCAFFLYFPCYEFASSCSAGRQLGRQRDVAAVVLAIIGGVTASIGGSAHFWATGYLLLKVWPLPNLQKENKPRLLKGRPTTSRTELPNLHVPAAHSAANTDESTRGQDCGGAERTKAVRSIAFMLYIHMEGVFGPQKSLGWRQSLGAHIG